MGTTWPRFELGAPMHICERTCYKVGRCDPFTTRSCSLLLRAVFMLCFFRAFVKWINRVLKKILHQIAAHDLAWIRTGDFWKHLLYPSTKRGVGVIHSLLGLILHIQPLDISHRFKIPVRERKKNWQKTDYIKYYDWAWIRTGDTHRIPTSKASKVGVSHSPPGLIPSFYQPYLYPLLVST
jgi:hypothetical protein